MVAVGIGVAFAIIVSMKEILFIIRTNSKHEIVSLDKSGLIDNNQKDNKLKDLPVSVLKPIGPLFFGSMESLLRTHSTAGMHSMLIIDMSKINMIDLSGVFALEDLIKSSKSQGVRVLVTGADSSIKETMEKVNFIKNIGLENYQESKGDIQSTIYAHYNLNI
jgi:SulP family sulfate permease